MFLSCFLLSYFILSASTDVSSTRKSRFLGYFQPEDKTRLKDLFENKIKGDAKEVDAIYHHLLGFTSLDSKPSNVMCPQIPSSLENPETVFHLAYMWRVLGKEKCKLTSDTVDKFAKSKLIDGITLEALFYTTMSMKHMGLPVNHDTLIPLITKAKTAKSSNPLGLGYLFQLLSQLGLSQSDLKTYQADLLTLLEQADEIDGNQLFYERGLYTTAVVAKGVLDFIEASGEVPNQVEDKIVKLFNYLYTHRETVNLRAAAHLVAAMKALTTSSVITPVIISDLTKQSHIVMSRLHPSLHLQLVHMWTGKPYSTNDIVLHGHGFYSLNKGSTDRVLIGPADRGQFKPAAGKTDTFEISLSSNAELLKAGSNYELEIDAKIAPGKGKKKLLGIETVQIPVRIVADFQVAEATIKISDKIHERHVSDIALTPPNLYRASTPSGSVAVELGTQLTWYFRFAELAKPHMDLKVHQAFVQFTHSKTKQVITFVCKQIAALGQAPGVMAYQLVLDPEESAADFDYVSGIYKAELIVGDFSISNPVVWHMADLEFSFAGVPGEESARRMAESNDISRFRSTTHAASKFAPGPNTLIGMGPISAKPEIDHMFRPPERRAPRTLAYLFALLCVLPLGFVLIAWLAIGFNLSNFRISLSGLLFHGGLGAIFYLYYVYWIRLDMFTTLGYLAILGVPTFLAGSSVLRYQAQLRQAAGTGSSSTGGSKK